MADPADGTDFDFSTTGGNGQCPLTPYVEQGYAIVIPSPSCSLMVREEYPQLVADPRSLR